MVLVVYTVDALAGHQTRPELVLVKVHTVCLQ
jgi:hypothetical protein